MKKFYVLILVALSFLNSYSQNNRWDNIFTNSNSPNDTLFATAVNGNNIFVGGTFDTVANIAANNVACFNGITWQSMGTGVNGNIYAVEAADSLTIVGGNFTLAGGVVATNLAIWNGTSWAVIGLGCNGIIRALKTHNQYLYVGGDFTTIGGISANHIARYDGTIWEALGTGTDGPVNAINYGNMLTVGGNFTTAGGVSCSNIANWNGASWLALADGFDGPVYSIEGNTGMGAPIIAAGNFNNSGTTLVRSISLWNGSAWTSLGGTNGIVYSIKLVGTSIFATGNFTNAGPQPANNIAQFDGSNWFSLGDGLNNTGYCIDNSNYDIVCGGIFTIAGINQSRYFARYYSPPVIIQQSSSSFNCLGDSVIIFANAVSGLSLTYQWDKDGTPVGLNNDSLIINSLSVSDGGIYTCTVTNSIGNVVSLPITLTVNQPPLYSATSSLSFCVGINDSISPSISGSLPISYQWYKNSVAISGETNNILSFLPAALSDSGNYYCIAQNLCGIDTTNIIKVSVFLLPNVTYSGLQNVYCENAISDTLQGIPAGGVFTGNGITDSIFTPAGFTNNQIITYTYTDLHGCSNNFIDTTFINSLPYVSFTGLNTNYCFNSSNDTLSVNILGGVYSGVGMTDSIFSPSIAGAGSHTVNYAYTDLNGCVNTISQSTFIYSPTIFTYIPLDTTFCDGDSSFTFSVYPYGGSLTGTTGLTDSTFSPQVAGIGNHQIIYTYTDSYGCVNKDTTIMSVHVIPTVQITSLNTFYCQNQTSVLLTGTPMGGDFVGSGISNNVLNPSLLTAGNYNVYYNYTDVYGCSSSDTGSFSLVTVADVYFTGVSSFYCPYDNNDTITGIPSGGTFSGQGISGNVFSPSIAGSGNFYVTYSYDNLNGCFSYDSLNITVATLPNIQLPQDVTICSGDSTTINSTGDAGIYLWSTLDTTTSITVNPLITTTYSVTVFDATCYNSDTITINTNPRPSVNLGADTSVCLPYVIIVNGNYSSYLWSDGTTNSSLTINASGNYLITVTNSFNCLTTDSIFINANPYPVFDLGNDISMQTTQTIIVGASSSFSSYLWNTGSTQNFVVISGETVGFGVHPYWLTVFNEFGCTYTDTIIVNVTSVGIYDISVTENILIYPNPVNDKLFVKLPENLSKPIVVTIYNETGDEMFKSEKHIANEIKIDLSQYVKGVYFVAVDCNNKKEITKIIKE